MAGSTHLHLPFGHRRLMALGRCFSHRALRLSTSFRRISGGALQAIRQLDEANAQRHHSRSTRRMFAKFPSAEELKKVAKERLIDQEADPIWETVNQINVDIHKIKLERALKRIKEFLPEAEAHKATPFCDTTNNRNFRDAYFDVKSLHSQLLQRQNKLSEALKILDSISAEFMSIPDLGSCHPDLASIHASRMARILKSQMDLCLIADANGNPNPCSDSRLETMREQFAMFEQFAEPDHIDTVAFYARLARGYMLLQKRKEAEEIVHKHLLFDLNQDVSNTWSFPWFSKPPESLEFSSSDQPMGLVCRQLEGRHCLAILNLGDGNMDSAALEKLYEECHKHIRGIEVPSHYSVFLSELAVTLIDKICNVAFLQERFDDAIVHLRDAIEAAKTLLNPAHVQVAHSRFTLAGILHHTERLPELLEVLTDFVESNPEPSLVIANYYKQLAEIAFVRFRTSHPRLSLDLSRSALEMRSVFVNPSEDLECAFMARGYATSLQVLQQYEESIKPLNDALLLCTGVVKGRGFHRGVITALASAFIETKKTVEAVKLLQDSMPMFVEGSGADIKVDRHAAFSLLSRALADLDMYKEANEYMEKAIAVLRDVPNNAHKLCVDLQDLGHIKLRLRDNEGAVVVFEELLKTLQSLENRDERAIASARRLLANALVAAKKFEAAAEQFDKCMDLLERTVPVDSLIPTLQQYGQVLRMLERHQDALDVEQKIRKLRE